MAGANVDVVGTIPGALAALGSAALWAFASARYAQVSRVIGSSAVNLVRALVVLPLFALATALSGGFGQLAAVTSAGLGWLFLSVLCSYALADNVFFAAARRAGITTALAIASSYPLWSALVGAVWLGERYGLARLAGTVVCVSGVIALVLLRGRRAELVRGGVGLALLTSALWAGNTFSVKVGSQGLSPVVANLVRYGVALPLVAVNTWLWPGPESIRASGAWRRLLLPSVLEAFVGSSLFVYALGHTPLGVGATLSSLAPLISVPIAIALGEERWSPGRFAAIVATVLGVILLVVGG